MRFVFDTQIYIEALRSPEGSATLDRLEDVGTAIWLSAVVARELMAGAPHRDDTRERAMILPFIARGLLVTPSFASWQRSGEAIAALHARRRIDRRGVTKAFANDLLLAASCAEEEITLVTRNSRDFALIAEEIPFEFIPPWPPFR
jgi:predicted nucleic acid-binding protein